MVVSPQIRRDNHDAKHGVKPKKKELEPPGFMRFFQQQARLRKKTATEFRFVHACCIHTRIVYKRSAGSGSLKANKNSGRVARMEIQVQDQGLFFTDAQVMENNVEVVSPIASGL
ncbi:hypothetical protein ACYZT2_22145 [Pseudomonas sp. MDT1-85]